MQCTDTHTQRTFISIFNGINDTFESSSNNVWRANELCTDRICAALLKVNPLLYASNDIQNSLKSVSVEPNFKSGCLQFNNKLNIACVAHALLITYNK